MPQMTTFLKIENNDFSQNRLKIVTEMSPMGRKLWQKSVKRALGCLGCLGGIECLGGAVGRLGVSATAA